MEPYKAIILIGVTVCCYTFSGVSNVHATGRSVEETSQVPASSPDPLLIEPPVSSISVVPASAPSPTSEDINTGSNLAPTAAVYAPGPSQEDIDINFDSVTNIADLAPKFEHINKFDFSSMKIDTTAKDLCKNTDYNNECIAAILPDLQKQAEGEGGDGGIAPKDVMRMEAESLLKKANATLDYAKRVVEDSKTPMPVKEAMSVCVENYDSLISGLEDAKMAMEEGDYGRLDSVLSAAISDVSTCSDNFVDIPDVDSPTASLDDLMKKLCSNVLAMSQKVQNR
ncbi:putative pectinesterase inhibitor domain-containing protein [Arabidopsis thaliana]